MEVPRQKERPRRFCEHCNNELSHSQYYDHRKRHFKNGVWERKSKRARSDNVQSLLISSRDPTGGSCVQPGVGEIDEREMQSEDPEIEVVEEHEEMHPVTHGSDKDETADHQSIHLFLDSSDSESVQYEEDISSVVVEREQLPADHKKLLAAISGLSRQLSRVATDMNEQFSAVKSRLLSVEDRLVALESKNCTGEANSKKRRRVHNPKIAEAVRRLHNSKTNPRRYDPEQGLNSPHNKAVTSCLLGAMSASPDLHDADNDEIVSACKTYYESIRRSFRYNQPGLAEQAEAAKISARSRSRRKRLLEARQSVLAADEVELWKSATVDLMSDEEDGTVDGVSGWIVRSPSFRSQELSELCTTLQSRLEGTPKYRATHHRRLQHGQPSHRTPPVTYCSEAAERQFTQL